MFGMREPRLLLLAFRAQRYAFESADARAALWQKRAENRKAMYDHIRDCNRKNIEEYDHLRLKLLKVSRVLAAMRAEADQRGDGWEAAIDRIEDAMWERATDSMSLKATEIVDTTRQEWP